MRRPDRAALTFTAATGSALIAVAVSAVLLPERVPTHFGAGGAADDWGTRTGAVVVQAAITAGTGALFAALARWMPTLPWEWINLPGKERWAEQGQQDEVRRRLRSDVLWLGSTVALLNTALTASTVDAARSGTDHLPWWFFLAFGTWLATITGYVVYMGLVRYRPPDR
ncbi:DUF1648 domain-containing protein [Kineococcus rubinsiae]|uniref:DUF1648 domain-containing protein n=1 Tax=Kineococcus rubinsiae TaxID=2609562 RepID=UPI00142F4A7F|nr:DUF1648 domain-containing protein [Kineococcus rubinsiae]NIZ90952.1 DUF1648 domain-containing protein [Kineococcus rubinsiae]